MEIFFTKHRTTKIDDKDEIYLFECDADIYLDKRILITINIKFSKNMIIDESITCYYRTLYNFSLFEKSSIMNRFHERMGNTLSFVMEFYHKIKMYNNKTLYTYSILRERFKTDSGYHSIVEIKELNFPICASITNDAVSFSSGTNKIPVLTDDLFPMRSELFSYLLKQSKHRLQFFFFSSVQKNIFE